MSPISRRLQMQSRQQTVWFVLCTYTSTARLPHALTSTPAIRARNKGKLKGCDFEGEKKRADNRLWAMMSSLAWFRAATRRSTGR